MMNAIKNPGILAEEVKQYCTDLTDSAEGIADKFLSRTSKKYLEDSEKAILKGIPILSHMLMIIK